MEPAIEAVGLSRSFGEIPVVHNATLSVAPGEITALVGPNGSGKTTLMLMLATLLRPDRGTVRIAGRDAIEDPLAARTALGWMPDALGVWPTLTVRETLLAVCGMYGLRGAPAAGRTDELLAQTELVELAGQRSNTLSRGQKQRLSLARALVHRPRVLLLDEPASGLDPEARLTQRRMLTELAAEGVAILVTSHVLDELDEISTGVVFLRKGLTTAPEAVDAALQRGSRWRVRSLDERALETELARLGIPATSRASLSGTVHLIDAADEKAATAALSALVSAGVPVVEFAPASSTLEQAFVRLSHPGTEIAADPEATR
ncbi:ABC transporter ATP-binding protein [Leucobacter iarius]|uniref:ABC transporter ATP-binding protein n=1 Tax=Leucobacter iarius TaxID=333963 RepID=A0ABP4XJJ2_9MICO